MRIVPTAEGMAFQSIRTLVEKKKEKAYLELQFIFFMYDLDSPYRDRYREEEREKILGEKIFGDVNWKPSRYYEAACQDFREFYTKHSLSISLLEGAEEAARNLQMYFEEVDFTLHDTKGNLVYNPKDVVAVIKGVGPLINGLKDLRKEVMKELEAETNKARGGVQVTPFNT